MTSAGDGPPKNGSEPAGLITPPASSSSGSSADSPPTQSVATGGVSSGETPLKPAREPQPPAFAAGQELAGRYRVVRFIARGGMGEVYEVEDRTLGGRVALKAVRADVVAETDTLDRFKREILVARRVSHPNVCRIHDVGFHETNGERPILFLTMELLHGETLTQRLAARGRLSPAEAMPIVAQIAAGLDAAHKAGVIHRDLKSSNVLLVPAPAWEGGVRAVVTDFGLARPASSDESLASLSETGIVVGTPAYMAPEQVEGRPLTSAADIYAFGIVLYEMVTKLRPFDGGSSLSVAVRRLTEPPTPPRQHVPELDPMWEATILRCLERDPAARFQFPLDVVAALTGQTVTPRPSATGGAVAAAAEVGVAPGRLQPAWRSRTLAAVIAATAVIIASLVWLRRAEPPVPPDSPRATVPVRRALAILGLKNTSGRADSDWMGSAASEMLATNLAAGERVRVLPEAEVARMRRDLGISGVSTLERAELGRVHSYLGADLVVLGSYAVVGQPENGLLRLDLRLMDAKTGGTLAEASSSGAETALFDLVDRASRDFRERLGLGQRSAEQVLQAEAMLPSHRKAARFYLEGLDKLRLGDAPGAKEPLEQAIAIEDGHPLPHAALAAAWSAMGYEAPAREEAKKALSLASALPGPQKLSIEARYHETTKEWAKAIETYAGLFRSFPDDVELGLRLAEAQNAGGKPKEALVTLEALRRLPAPASNDPRIEVMQARVHQGLSDWRETQRYAAAAARKAEAIGARLLVANALLFEATALRSLGKPDQALAAAERARDLYEAAGDKRGTAIAVERIAVGVYRKGDLDGARRLFERALALYREVGDGAALARVLHNTGNVLRDLGRGAEAEKLYAESLAGFLKIGAKRQAAQSLNSIGANLHNRGELAAAEKKYAEALRIFGEIGERGSMATAITNLGELLLARGDPEGARKMHEDALAIDREIGKQDAVAYDLYRLGAVFLVRGDLSAAKDRYEEALRIQTGLGEKNAAAVSRVGLARVALADGKAADAEKLSREAEEILRTNKAADRALSAKVVLGEALLAQGKLAEAKEVKEGVVAAGSDDPQIASSAAILDARVRAAAGGSSEALRLLERTRLELAKRGMLVLELEARLAQGQIERAQGKPGARARLDAVARQAKAKGLGLIARRASEA